MLKELKNTLTEIEKYIFYTKLTEEEVKTMLGFVEKYLKITGYLIRGNDKLLANFEQTTEEKTPQEY